MFTHDKPIPTHTHARDTQSQISTSLTFKNPGTSDRPTPFNHRQTRDAVCPVPQPAICKRPPLLQLSSFPFRSRLSNRLADPTLSPSTSTTTTTLHTHIPNPPLEATQQKGTHTNARAHKQNKKRQEKGNASPAPISFTCAVATATSPPYTRQTRTHVAPQ